MENLKEWVLFPLAIRVQAQDKEEAIAKAKTWLQQNLNSIEFEDVIENDEIEKEIDEEEIIKTAGESDKIKREFEDEDY